MKTEQITFEQVQAWLAARATMFDPENKYRSSGLAFEMGILIQNMADVLNSQDERRKLAAEISKIPNITP